MSKNFKAVYTVDATNLSSTEDLILETIIGKLNASELTRDDLSTLIITQIKAVLEDNKADALIVYPDGTCDIIKVEELVEKVAKDFRDLICALTPKKKIPWYKKLWNKISGKKNK